MAEVKEATENAVEEETNGSSETNGSTGRTALRAAAIAAASGATAIAAKKAFSSRSESDEGDDEENGRRKQGGGADSVLTTALTSGWDSARDSVVPMLGNAAVQAGEYVARNSPELVRDTIVPQFIRGFQRARKNSDEDEE
jgi:hypothetical protein